MYDFILFENFHWAINHYKDLTIIAELLVANGYSVAIADVFQEGKYCRVENVPHIRLSAKKKFNIKQSRHTNKVLALFENVYNKIKIDHYLRDVVKELSPQAKNFYIGSYHASISRKWLKSFPTTKNLFIWGLRSSRMYEYKIRPFSLVGINSYFLRKHIDRNENIRFFVSDELIRNEFKELGYLDSRLVLRPERYVKKLNFRTSPKDELRLLSIGSIRPNKQIEKIIDAISSDMPVIYTIAGKADNEYESKLIQQYECKTNIKRLNYRIPEDEYMSLISNCDFLMLCDIQQKTLVTNGTMNEALLNGVPIIAPDYDPYKYYITKYGVGILFNPSDTSSINKAIKKAIVEGKKSFQNSIKEYQKSLLFEDVCINFGNQIKRIVDSYESIDS